MAIYKEDVAEFIWRNGEIIPWKDATIHVNSVGHASVAGIFEGIKAYWSEKDKELYVFRLRDHMVRFINSIKMVRYGFDYDLPALEKAVLDLLKANKFKISISGPMFSRRAWSGNCFSPSRASRRSWSSIPGPSSPIVPWTRPSMSGSVRGCAFRTTSCRPGSSVFPITITAGSRRWKPPSTATTGRSCWTTRGRSPKAPAPAFLIVRNNTVIAPPITAGILESITRDTVATIFRDMLKIDFVERPVDRTELYAADEVFYVGTGWEIMPVALVDRITVGDGKTGPVTRASAEAYRKIVLGEVKKIHRLAYAGLEK